MTQLQNLIKEKSDLHARLDVLLDAMQGNPKTGVQARALTDEETTEIEQARTKLEGLEKQITNLQFLEDQKRQRAGQAAPRGIDPGTAGPSEYERALEDFSLSRAAQGLAKQSLNGVEKEVSDEAARLARESGITPRGGVMIPFRAPKAQERADNGIASASGNLIATTLMPSIMGYEVRPFVVELGATMHSNLVGVNEIPVEDLIASAEYATESATLSQIDPTVRKATLTPKPVVAKVSMTNLLKASAGAATADGLAYRTLAAAERNAVEAAIINGSSPAPTGIYNNSDVPTLDLAASGNITFADLLTIKNNPAKNKAFYLPGTRGWVTNEDVRTFLESQQHGTSGKFIWPTETPDQLLGYKAVTTSLVPNDGGDNNDESGMIFGIWSNLHVANWAFRELVIDTYSSDSKTWFKWYSYWCHALSSPKAFAKCRNILTVETT